MVGTLHLSPRTADAAASKAPAGPVDDDAACQVHTDAAKAEHTNALAHAEQAEAEAVATAKDCEVAAAHNCDALECATRARTAAADPPPNDDHHSNVDDPDDAAIHDAMLVHEAAALLNLHA